MTDFEQPTMNCPRCRKEYDDFDGVGVIYCQPPEGCGFCRHVARSGQPDGSMKCDYCGDIAPVARNPACEVDSGDRESECYSQCRASRDGDCYDEDCPQEKDRKPRCPLDLLCVVHDAPAIPKRPRVAQPKEPAPMTDIAAIRKRAEWFTVGDWEDDYAQYRRGDRREHGANESVADAIADRDDLLREVDRLTEELKDAQRYFEHSDTHRLKAERERDAARTAAQNEATQRQKAEAERDQARATLALHPFGACTCCGEGTCPWCHVTEVKEQNDKLRAELEALRAPLPDAELVEIEREHAEVSEQFDRWGVDGKAGGVAHGHRGTLLRALRAEREAHAKTKTERDEFESTTLSHSFEECCMVREENNKAHALLSSCRPVVEAVLQYQRAPSGSDQEKSALEWLAGADLPTLPEKP